MDHAEARDLLETAAVEPGGLDRLMAGDTPEAAALAGHLAGCPDCTRLMARLRRDASVIAGVVRTTPPPGLRDRTLSYVRTLGRDRSGLAAAAPLEAVGSSGGTGTARSRSRMRGLAFVAGLAAVLVAAVVATGAILDARRELAANDAEIARQAGIVAALSRVTTWTIRIEGQPDARRVALSSPAGSTAAGTILYSPGSRELVVVATGLVEPEAGRALYCWVEVGGGRERVGKMFFGGDLSYWAGEVEPIGTIPPGARFGVSLVDAADNPVGTEPVLSGS